MRWVTASPGAVDGGLEGCGCARSGWEQRAWNLRMRAEAGSPGSSNSPSQEGFLPWSLCPRCFQRVCVKPKPRGGREHPVSEASLAWVAGPLCMHPRPPASWAELELHSLCGESYTSFLSHARVSRRETGCLEGLENLGRAECLLGLAGVGFELFAQLCQTSYSELLSNFLLGELRDFRSHLLLLLHTLCHFHLL